MSNFEREMSAIKSAASKEMREETPIESSFLFKVKVSRLISLDLWSIWKIFAESVEISTLQIIQDSCQDYGVEKLCSARIPMYHTLISQE